MLRSGYRGLALNKVNLQTPGLPIGNPATGAVPLQQHITSREHSSPQGPINVILSGSHNNPESYFRDFIHVGTDVQGFYAI